MPPQRFDELLLRKRKDAHLTQEELAQRVGRREKDIARWETGKNLPHMSSVRRLAEELDAPELVQAALDRADALDVERRARRRRRRGT